ncbi:hypothetical protein B566_EDAN014770 [Ephemera danica]|nr:hypothetical protein B566_EDAN014770 [Ephemera danica]
MLLSFYFFKMRQVQLFSAILLILVATPWTRAAVYDLGHFELTLSDNEAPYLKSSATAQIGGRPKNLNVQLGLSIPPEDLIEPLVTLSNDGKLRQIKFGASTLLDIKQPNAECTEFTWTSPDLTEVRDCVSFGTANWYGGPEQKEQLWPVEKLKKRDYSYVTKEDDNMGIAERIWINSEGIYFYVAPEIPLYIDSNVNDDNRLCFVSKFDRPYLPVAELQLRYSLCSLPDAIQAQNHYVTVTLPNGKPRAVPDLRMIEHPIWSTWARYKRDINESVVEAFANEILFYGYLNSQIEIDDLWETCYGELTFDLQKFPDPAGLTQRLKAIGYRVTLWVHPFVNFNCPSFEAWRAAGYFVHDEEGNVRTQWWNGLQAAIVDFTNPNASSWYVNRLLALKESSGVDSFKYDAGETSWMPNPRILNAPPELQPNIYSAKYVRALDVPELGPISEIRSGFETKDLPTFVRMVDKDSHWGINNGLRSLVTTLLAMNMAGYSIVLPDMIGGNGYGNDVITPELFVRWLQATTFMSTLQFSLTSEIGKAMLQAVTEGKPVNSPVFYAAKNISADDPAIFAIDDQFMLGERILVAPVLDEGAISRDVYLPSGAWQDMNSGTQYAGAQWLRNFPVPIDKIAAFQIPVPFTTDAIECKQ